SSMATTVTGLRSGRGSRRERPRKRASSISHSAVDSHPSCQAPRTTRATASPHAAPMRGQRLPRSMRPSRFQRAARERASDAADRTAPDDLTHFTAFAIGLASRSPRRAPPPAAPRRPPPPPPVRGEGYPRPGSVRSQAPKGRIPARHKALVHFVKSAVRRAQGPRQRRRGERRHAPPPSQRSPPQERQQRVGGPVQRVVG